MPNPTTGASSWLKLQSETDGYKGTPSIAELDLAFVSAGLKPEQETFAADPSLGGMAPKSPQSKFLRGEGDFEFATRFEGFDPIFLAILGQVDINTIVVGEYEKLFYPQSDVSTNIVGGTETEGHRSFAGVEVVPADATDFGYAFQGMKINSFSAAITNENILLSLPVTTAPLTRQTSDPGAASFLNTPIILGGTSTVIRVKRRGTGAWVTADEIGCVQSASVDVTIPVNNTRECVGSWDAQEPKLDGQMEVTIGVERENPGSLMLLEVNQPLEMSILMTGPTITTVPYVFEFYFPYVLVGDLGPDISDAGVNPESLTFTAWWDTDQAGRSNDPATTQRDTNMILRTVNTVATSTLV